LSPVCPIGEFAQNLPVIDRIRLSDLYRWSGSSKLSQQPPIADPNAVLPSLQFSPRGVPLSVPRKVIVIEERPRFAPLLMRSLSNDVLVEVQSHDWNELFELIRDEKHSFFRAAIIICVIEHHPADRLRDIATLAPSLQRSETTPIPIIAIVREADRSLEWTLRELGVASVVDQYVSTIELTKLCRRHIVVYGRATESSGVSTN